MQPKTAQGTSEKYTAGSCGITPGLDVTGMVYGMDEVEDQGERGTYGLPLLFCRPCLVAGIAAGLDVVVG